MSTANADQYYVPHHAYWPIVGSIGMTFVAVGVGVYLNGIGFGLLLAVTGLAIIIGMSAAWFGDVIRESETGYYNEQVDRSFRQGMAWFIFSEVMFFAVFFGALFYARVYSVPWLGGEGTGVLTHAFLHADYQGAWPTHGPAALGGAFETIGAWGIPALNTAILLTSGVTITFAHWALKEQRRQAVVWWLVATWVLGLIFLGFQTYEYIHGWVDLNLTLGSGIYGSTFYMLTGFHGFHVTLGVIMLIVITARCARGHFAGHNHFGFEGVAWYWHFVDVVWLGLFVFVYWL